MNTRGRIRESRLNSLLFSVTVFVTMFVAVFVTGLDAAQNRGAGKPATGGASHAMSARYEDLQWQSIVPELGKDSPQISILRVDPQTHATQLLIRSPKKMHVPMHWHSANETHTMIKGTAVFDHEGQREQLGPGSFNYIPAKMQHQAWTSEGAVIFITVDGAWDVNWVGSPPSKSDLGQTPPGGSLGSAASPRRKQNGNGR